MSRPPPGARADYRSFVPVTTRWMDNDVFGHVNNAVYYSLIDTAVTTLLVRWGILTWPGPHRAMVDRFMVVAEGGCRFHSEVAFPDPLTAGVRISRMGDRSARIEVGIFRDNDPVAAAEGFLVHVCVDAATRRPVPLPDDWRRILQPLVVES
jgi:acyl-CoA thioester hydrolase